MSSGAMLSIVQSGDDAFKVDSFDKDAPRPRLCLCPKNRHETRASETPRDFSPADDLGRAPIRPERAHYPVFPRADDSIEPLTQTDEYDTFLSVLLLAKFSGDSDDAPAAPVVDADKLVFAFAYVGESFVVEADDEDPLSFDQTDSEYFDSGGQTFTAPYSGVYLAAIRLTADGEGGSAIVEFTVDGVASGYGIHLDLDGTGERTMHGNVFIPIVLSAGAKVEIVQSGNDEFTVNGNNQENDEHDSFVWFYLLSQLDSGDADVAPVLASDNLVLAVVYIETAYTVPAVDFELLTWDAVWVDEGGLWDADANGFKATVAGVYLVSLHLSISGEDAESRSAIVELMLDGEPTGFGINIDQFGEDVIEQGNCFVPIFMPQGSILTVAQSGNDDFDVNGKDNDDDELDSFFAAFLLFRLEPDYA